MSLNTILMKQNFFVQKSGKYVSKIALSRVFQLGRAPKILMASECEECVENRLFKHKQMQEKRWAARISRVSLRSHPLSSPINLSIEPHIENRYP